MYKLFLPLGFFPRKIIVILFVMVSCFVNAQGPWSQRAAMPGPARHRGFTFTIGQRGYFGCGWNGVTMYNDFWEYDPGTDTWIQKANYPGGPRLSPFGFAIGNKGYAGTGLDASLWAQPDFYEYNPATNQWTARAPFIGTPIFGATAVVWNNTGVIMFGDDWAPNYWKHNEIYSYNATTNAWSYVGVFPGDGRRDHVACILANKIYFGTGNNNSYQELNDWWEWDPGSGNMIQKATFIGSPRSQGVGFAVNGRGYVGTGGTGDERDFFEYNAASNTWQGIDEFPGSGRENAMTFVIGTRAFLIAGTSGINYHDTWEFNSALVTGTDEECEIAQVKIWPNPATDIININLQENNAGVVSYQIYTISGHLVSEATNVTTGPVLQIPVYQLASGTYELTVLAGNTRLNGRFVR